MTTVPFYADWKFWSVAVSFLALLLSQLPPIHMLLRRAKLEVDAYSRIVINHKVGNPNVQLHLILSNVGGRTIKVKSISLQFKRGNEDIFTLPAQNFFDTPSDKGTVLLTSFKLKPSEEWGHVVNFLNFFTRSEEKDYRQIDSALRSNILAKRALLIDKNIVVEADQDIVQPVLAFFQKKFRWHTGEYEISLNVVTEPSSAGIKKDFRVTLFESDTKDLQDYQNDYKFGAGVNFDPPEHAGQIIPLIPREV